MNMQLKPLIDLRLSLAIPVLAGNPKAIIIVGPIASGKTTVRRKNFGDGYVHVDSADIFHELSNGDASFDFPAAFAREIDYVGREVTRLAFDRRLPVVLETPGDDGQQMNALLAAFKSIGYQAEIAALSTDRGTCERWHASRGDNVSSYWAAPLHVEWLISECLARASA